MMPEAVRSSSTHSDRLHRPHRDAEGDLTVACNQNHHASHTEWLPIEMVTRARLVWRDLCRHCFPPLKGAKRCVQCDAELDRKATTPVDGYYVAEFGCPTCDVFGGITLDPETGKGVCRQGPAFVERDYPADREPLIADGG